MSSDSPEAASFNVGSEPVVVLGTGQEAVIVDAGSTEELISADGLVREQIGAPMTRFGLKVQKSSVPVAKLLQKETLLTCCFILPSTSPNIVCRSSWVSKRLHQLYENENESQPAPPTVHKQSNSNQPFSLNYSDLILCSDSSTSNAFTPASYASSAVPSDMRVEAGTELVNIGSDHYKLATGTLLALANKQTTIDTAYGTIICQPGSAILVSTDRAITQVLNLVDHNNGDVIVIAHKRSYNLAPGGAASIVATPSKTKAVNLTCREKLARRRMQILDVNPNTQLVVNDFSIMDALQRIPLLSNLHKCSNRADQHLFSNIVKMAAVLSMTTDRTRGSYSVIGGQ